MSIFSKPKVPSVEQIQQQAGPPPAPAPTQADASVQAAGNAAGSGYSSLVSTGASGLKRKARTAKSSLIGGA